jgi:hypothetical protein
VLGEIDERFQAVATIKAAIEEFEAFWATRSERVQDLGASSKKEGQLASVQTNIKKDDAQL